MKPKVIIAAFVLMVCFSVLAFSQSRDTGAITGKVTDEEGNALPGVTVTLTSPNLMGVRSVVTDVSGLYRFPALPPGSYQVKAELQGFATVVRENIRLTTTTTLSVELTLRASSLEERVTVIAQAPTVDVKSTETASVTLTNEILRNIPNTNFTADLVNMAPGVNNDAAFGASDGTGISYQMDGVGVGDPEGGTAWVFVDSNIIEEAKIMGIGLPAEYGNFTGVIFNLVTKSGGNEFTGHMEFLFQGKKGDSPAGLWQSDNNGAYLEDFPDMTSPLSKLLDVNFHLGGPIKKDKLWFFAGLQYYRTQDYETGFPEAIDYKQPRGFIKLTSQISPSLSINASVEHDTYTGEYRDGSSINAPEATVNQTSPETVPNFSLTYVLSPKTFFDVKASMFSGYYYLEPRMGRDVNSHYYINDNPALPPGSGNKFYDNATYYYLADRGRYQANASLTHYAEDFIKGNHDFKFGAEIEHSKVRTRYGYTGTNHTYYVDLWDEYYGYAGNYLAYQNEGYDIDSKYTRLEAFAQDSWQVTDRLNVSLGARMTQNWGSVRDRGNVYSTFRIAPRLGFTFDLLGDKSTVLKAHYGQFTEGMFSYFFDRMNTSYSDEVTYLWDPVEGVWNEDFRESHGVWSVADGIKHPYMSQFTIGVERELFKDTSLSLTYINRKWNNMVSAYNTLAVYEPRTVTIDELGKDYTVYELVSGNAYNWVIDNIQKGDPGVTGDPYRKYWGFEVLFNKRFSNRWQMLASYVYSKAYGTIDNTQGSDVGYGVWSTSQSQSQPGDPNYWINADGNSFNDPTHMIKIQASYLLPFDINFNAYFHANTGYAWTTRYRTQYFNQGNITFFAEPRGSHHYPMRKYLDLRLEKIFTLAGKYRLGLIFDVFNVFNTNTVTSWGTRIGYDWYPGDWPSTDGHELYSIVLPRQARVGIRLIF